MSFALRHNRLSQVHKFVHSAQNVFKLLDPDDQELMLDNPVEIQEQSAPEKDEEPNEKTMVAAKSTEVCEFIRAGIAVFENTDLNKDQATNG
jgi:hypothetical protein